jgi:subtilisin family serine protease
MARNHLTRQIEQIVDEASDDRLSVIVQMQTSDELESYLQAATEAIGSRRAVTSARKLVPPSKQQLRVGAKGTITPAARRDLQQSDPSAALVFLANEMIRPLATKGLKAIGLAALTPLVQSDFVVRAIAAAVARAAPSTAPRGRPAAKPVPNQFPISGSAVLELSKDDLAKLPENVPMIADIFPNRPVRVPPVAKSTTLPRVVEDNKANAWGLARTGALASWGAFGARGKGAVIAILDTGVDATHPDLRGKIAGFAEFGENGQLVTDKLADAYDSDEHGTHCAGIVVGGKESGRWIGMAPEAKILAALVLKGGTGSDAQVLAGMEWAITNGAQVISMSLGGLRMAADVLDTYTRAIINANRVGIPVVVAVGNEGSQTSGMPGNDYFAFTIGATDSEDWAAGFSGGRTQVFSTSRYIKPEFLPLVYSKPEVSAPGVDIYSSTPNGGYAAWNGTSMATPHVAGAMALLLGEPSDIAAQPESQRTNLLQSLLISTVKELGEAGQNHRFGHGRIDVLRALGYARELGYFKE